MPTYDYECSQGHRFEVFQKMSDDPVVACPECGAEVQRKISGGAGFLFKGEGFYITDYRSEEYRKKASAEAPSSDRSSSATSSASESSPKKETSSTKETGGAGGSAGGSAGSADS